MGRIPTIAIIAVVLVLIIGISAAVYFLVIKEKQTQLVALRTALAQEQAEAAQRSTVEAEKARVEADWLRAQQELAALRERKSIRISMYMPLVAMTAIWYEYREDLPAAVQEYVESQGVTIETGASMPAPPLAPPTVPATGFMQVPAGQTITLTVSGTMAQLENLYRNLNQLPRIATIGGLSLSGTGERLTATVPMTLYILVEGAEAAAPPPAAAMGGMDGGGAMGGAPGMGGPGGPPGAPGGGGEEAGAGDAGDDGGGGGDE